MKFRQSILLFLFLIVVQSVPAQEIPSPMSPPRLVNDFAKIFDDQQLNSLEQTLRTYHDTTSTQIYIVTVPTLDGYAPSDYATRLGHQWGVGQKGKSNGAVILIKPRIGNERGQVYIAVGYGLEPVLNDARIGRIIDTYMLPHLAQEDYYHASKAAVTVMTQMLAGEFQADPAASHDMAIGDIIFAIIVIIIIVFIFSAGSKGGGNSSSSGPRNRGGGGGPVFFPPMGGGGSFGGGGFGGGGFGGGGGGGFGGGGAGRGF